MTPDLIVGTSAGSQVGVQIAGGTPFTELEAAQLAAEPDEGELAVDFDIDAYLSLDGGTRSFANADLAAGHDRVLVIVPMALGARHRDQLDAELEILAKTGNTRVIAADGASLAAIGPNPLDPSRRPAAYRAGHAQGEAVAVDVAAFWS